MTDIAAVNAAAVFSGHAGGVFELVIERPQPPTGSAGRGQFVTINAAGQATLNGGGYVMPGGIAYPAFVSSPGAPISLWCGTETGMVQSSAAGDGFTDADFAVPFYIVDAQTPGKLPVLAGVDRAIGGLVFGMEPGRTTQPRLAVGPIPGMLALAAHMFQNDTAGSLAYAVDASATTDLASSTAPWLLPRAKRRGKITSIEIIPSAALAATSGNDAILTVVKVDTTGTVALASSPVVGTFTTTTALVAGVPALFTLSATAANLLLRTTDILGYYRTHNVNGAVIPQSAIRANFQVI